MNPKRSELTARQRELVALFHVDGLRATFTPDAIIPDWADVKKVFIAFGARWLHGPRGGKGHFLFASGVDAQQFEDARQSGDFVDPKANDFFPTPDWLADEIVGYAHIRAGMRVLEPSAGKGAIALAIRRAAPRALVHCCELLPDHRAHLVKAGFDVVAEDFLECPVRLGPYDAIVMNPPFGKDCGREHVLHALTMLVDGGSLVAILPSGVTFRNDRASVAFRARIDELGGTLLTNAPDAFAESGTMCRTVTLILENVRATRVQPTRAQTTPVATRVPAPAFVFEDDPSLWVIGDES